MKILPEDAAVIVERVVTVEIGVPACMESCLIDRVFVCAAFIIINISTSITIRAFRMWTIIITRLIMIAVAVRVLVVTCSYALAECRAVAGRARVTIVWIPPATSVFFCAVEGTRSIVVLIVRTKSIP